ncbi:MAG: DUF6049 family protein [Sporichthyaceae bacterium]
MSAGRRRWAAAAGALGLILATLCAGPVRAADTPSPAPEATAPVPPTGRVTLAVLSQKPVAPKGNDTVILRGTLGNGRAEELRRARLELRVGTAPVPTRSELASIANAQVPIAPGAPAPDTAALPAPNTRVVRAAGAGLPAAITAGTNPGWELSVPVRRLALPGNGVYVIQVVAYERTGTEPVAQVPIAQVTSFLSYLPDLEAYAPTRVSWLWPLAAVPDRDARGVFTDTGLASQLAPSGRLHELATAPGALPVTWLLDPDLLSSADALGAPHEVRNGRKVSEADAIPAALTWLTDLRTTLEGQPVAAFPYADPDVVALGRFRTSTLLTDALERARTSTTTLLGQESDTSLAWPADGAADRATLARLFQADVRTIVLRSDALLVDAPATYTPTGRARFSDGDARMEVLVADAGLADALAGELRTPGASAAARARFLAETALITLERPNQARTVLVTPPRRWDPPAGWAASLLRASTKVPWLRTVPLSTLSKIPPAPEYDGADSAYSEQIEARELSRPHLAGIRAGSRAANDLARVLARPDALMGRYSAALLRATSTAWREQGGPGRAYLDDVLATIRADQGSVRIIGRSLITLSSNRGTLPLTVSNQLGQGNGALDPRDLAVRVRPILRPQVGSRLKVSDSEMLTVGAGRKATVRVEIEATANGITRVDAALLDAQDRSFGAAVELKVNVTSYGSFGMVLVVITGSGLLLAAVLRNVRRFRRARAEAHT